MSLLLDARKKSQHAQSTQAGNGRPSGLELSLEPPSGSTTPNASQPPQSSVAPSTDKGRIAGQTLFNAKSRAPSFARAGISRNLLIVLGGTILLFFAGAGYVWHSISASNNQMLRPLSTPILDSVGKQAPATNSTQNNLVPEIASTKVASQKSSTAPKLVHAAQAQAKSSSASPRASKSNSVHIEQNQDESINPLLQNAYLAYRGGKFEQAQQLYHEVLNLDSNNIDALLGLGAIAQRRGGDNMAAHYYAKVLTLDPRNAVANAGMPALTADDNRESRLKSLLNEQRNSSSLHFALGNYYAEQARWGEAQQSYFNAYKLEPDNAELAFNLAVSLDRLGQNKPAAQYYQHALRLDPDHNAGFDHARISQRIEELTH